MESLDIRTIGNDTEPDRLLNKLFKSNVRNGYVEIGDDNVCLPGTYCKWAEKIRKFEVRNDDVYVMGMPRTGTTWTQEMVWLIINDMNFEGAREGSTRRVPVLELDVYYGETDVGNLSSVLIGDNTDALTHLDRFKNRRCIKTHLHWSLLPEGIVDGSKNPKIIYVLRNPKDACVSVYNVAKMFSGYEGTIQEMGTLYLAGRVTCGPFWKSVLSFWAQRDRANILFIRYKDMINDLGSVIKKVAAFLKKPITEKETELLINHLSIENMRKNAAVNNVVMLEKFSKPLQLAASATNCFIGTGKQNNHLTAMSPELIKKFDEWTAECLAGTGLIID